MSTTFHHVPKPLSQELLKTGYGYQLDEQTKINHLFYVDGLKLYGTSNN